MPALGETQGNSTTYAPVLKACEIRTSSEAQPDSYLTDFQPSNPMFYLFLGFHPRLESLTPLAFKHQNSKGVGDQSYNI